MVNYRYIASDLEANNRKYLLDGQISVADQISELLEQTEVHVEKRTGEDDAT